MTTFEALLHRRDEVVEYLRCVADATNRGEGFLIATATALGVDDCVYLAAAEAYNATPIERPSTSVPDAEWNAYQRDRALNAALLVEEGAL